MNDLYEHIVGRPRKGDRGLLVSRLLTLFWGVVLGFWGVVFIGFASLFQDSDTPVIELGLSIASFTYGSLLGVFLLGLWHERSRESDAIIAFAVTIGAMVLVIFGVWHSPAEGGFVLNPADAYATDASLKGIGGPGIRPSARSSISSSGASWHCGTSAPWRRRSAARRRHSARTNPPGGPSLGFLDSVRSTTDF